jgi:galactose mutarotase-like enzyme
MSIERRAGPGPLESWVLALDEAEVRVVPSRGAIVTHWAVKCEALLFLDEATLVDPKKNVRGGVPLLFPNAGPIPAEGVTFSGRRITQPQHGLARLAAWSVLSAVSDTDTARLELGLDASDATRAGFPFEFKSRLAVSLASGALTLEWRFENHDTVAMPVHAGLHPYFTVPVAQKAAATVPTTATRLKDRRSGEVRPLVPVRFDDGEPDVAYLEHGPSASLVRGDGSVITLSSTPQLSTLVLWTLPGQPFVCVEPWTAPGGALASGEGLLAVAPGDSLSLAVRFSYAPRR